jgi:hypothetical protein
MTCFPQAPAKASPEIVEEIIESHLKSPAFWAVFPLQDFMGMDGALRHPDPEKERINIPAIKVMTIPRETVLSILTLTHCTHFCSAPQLAIPHAPNPQGVVRSR